jgi:hypothetical protein
MEGQIEGTPHVSQNSRGLAHLASFLRDKHILVNSIQPTFVENYLLQRLVNLPNLKYSKQKSQGF